MRDLQDSRATIDLSGLRTAWRTALDRELKQTPFERLVTRSDDGLELLPLYAPDDLAALADPVVVPPRHSDTFEVRTLVDAADPALSSLLADDFAGGADGVFIDGLPHVSQLDAIAASGGVIALDAGAHAPTLGAALALRGARDLRAGFDPIAVLAASGTLPFGPSRLSDIVTDLVTKRPAGLTRPLAIDTRPYTEAGAPPAMALGIGLAVIVAAARSLHDRGIGAVDFFGAIELRVAVDSDTFVEIARLRALRACLARIGELLGATAAATAVPTYVVQARRSLTAADPWVNLLRGTHTAFVAALGGASGVSLLPFDSACGQSDALARRVARNTALVLRDESHLTRVDDPAAGSWYVDHLTASIAARAWATLQEIESEGGAFASVLNGAIARRIEPLAAGRALDVARRKRPITGVSEFPATREEALSRPAKAEPILPSGEAVEAISSVFDAVARYDYARATLALAAGDSALSCAPLVAIRDAAPFEALRARTRGRGAGVVFAAAIGDLAEFRARAEWATNALGTSGLIVPIELAYADVSAAVAAYAASGAPAALIIGTDATYDATAAPLAAALKAAGARCVIMAQKPKDPEALKAAGVDLFVHVGAEIPAVMTLLLDAAGVA